MPSTSPKIILFNGPPRSGKDTCADIAASVLRHRGVQLERYKFAEPLKDAVHALFGMAGILTEHFDGVKGEPCDQFMGMTPREAYIWLSQECVKPKFGDDFFTKIAIRHIGQFKAATVVISDCGFQAEVDGLIKAFGAENVLVVMVQRQGCDFSRDSRDYVSAPVMELIVNNRDKAALVPMVEQIVGGFCNA